jgi:hypothetical protein
MTAKQFTLYLENRPGALARVTKALAEGRVNIDAISVSASADVALVQIVASDALRARRILARGRVPFTEQDVALVRIPNRIGELSRGVARLARAGININYIYATTCDCVRDCPCYAVVSAPNLKAVEKAWKG